MEQRLGLHHPRLCFTHSQFPRGRSHGHADRYRRRGAQDSDVVIITVNASSSTSTVFFDDFESDLGWIVNPGTDTATTGQWGARQPEDVNYNGPKQLGTTVSGSNDLVTARLAGSSAGAQ
ncbi:MAG: hypothetical protein R2911_08895 [Caldilineaceae bacterium]